MTRHDPGAEPILRRPRRSAMHGRQIVPVLHVEAAPDPIDDEIREFCATADVPACARAIGVEACRRQVDALATDLYPARQLEDARDREAHLAALIADAQRDGATTPAAIAAHLTRMGVAVRR